jgi:hypothetical protein
MENVIKFSHNWNNKLDCGVFTTIRNATEEKYNYYKDSRAQVFNVQLKGKGIIKKANLMQVRKMKYALIEYSILAFDTGIIDPVEQLALFQKFGMKEITSEMLILTFSSI